MISSACWYFFFHCRKAGDNVYRGTTWQIKFKLDNVDQTGTYKLRLALASANMSILEVKFNTFIVLQLSSQRKNEKVFVKDNFVFCAFTKSAGVKKHKFSASAKSIFKHQNTQKLPPNGL